MHPAQVTATPAERVDARGRHRLSEGHGHYDRERLGNGLGDGLEHGK